MPAILSLPRTFAHFAVAAAAAHDLRPWGHSGAIYAKSYYIECMASAKVERFTRKSSFD